VFEKVVVTYNGSEQAERALLTAIRLSRTVQAELHAVHVVGHAPAYTAYAAAVSPAVPEILHQDRKALADALLDKARTTAQDHGIKLFGHQIEGSEAASILDFLRTYKADLLVVGLHPRDMYISRLWSTLYTLAQDSPCSVLGVH
jgi:nucleotide-binding universal stress UspA family protein